MAKVLKFPSGELLFDSTNRKSSSRQTAPKTAPTPPRGSVQLTEEEDEEIRKASTGDVVLIGGGFAQKVDFAQEIGILRKKPIF